MQWEFESILQFVKGQGIDVGCGTNRLSENVLAIDQQPDKRYSKADIVHNCHDLDITGSFEFKGYVYNFKDESLDFIFSSHCLEDFDDIPAVFQNWWRKIKPDGLMILLLPDMENGRYPLVGALGGNPSHKTNVGKKYIVEMLDDLGVKYEVIQSDTLPHDKTCTIDIVLRKIGG